ncbi:DNA polymerase III subunit delta [Bifidobacterium choloepi]|uniref:DNA-directed DNA polymerase n=1 Tax=Bifidobacterium choloepi TaxID=2614131 RepID=A0A6I5MWV8_9BIFI|nr:DNA polymerase III subunit delta [Bifidobacterium choloepi]NEG69048.1 DNA polymerase III subunit delta [Bifidobacterium choloepi]
MASRPVTPCTIVAGGDPYLNHHAVLDLRHQAEQRRPDRETIELDATEATQYDFDQAVSPSLLSDAAIVVIDNYQNATDELADAIAAWLKTAADEPDPSTVIVSHAAGPKGKRNLDRLVRAGAARQDIPDLKKPAAKLQYVRQQFERRHRAVTPAAAQQLVGVLGTSIGELTAMIGQLCDDFDDNPVDLDRVNQYLDANPQVTGFEIADTALAGDTGHAIVLLRSALEQGAEPIALVGALAAKLRTMAKAAALQSGEASPADIHDNPWALKNARRQLGGWTSAGMGRCLCLLAWADEQCKTNGADPAYALEQCVEAIAAKGAAR